MSNEKSSGAAVSLKTLLIAVISLILLVLGYVWSQARMTYPSFVGHKRPYFVRLAEACEEIRSQFNAGMRKQRVQGNDLSLPSIIRHMNAEYVVVGTNNVAIVVNSGRGNWGVYWMQSPDKSWELSAYGEDIRTPVFSTNLPAKR